MTFLSKIFGSNEREIKKFQPIIASINARESEMRRLSDGGAEEQDCGVSASGLRKERLWMTFLPKLLR